MAALSRLTLPARVRPGGRRRVVFVASLLVAALVGAYSSDAEAADIAAVVGQPGDATWLASCPAVPAPQVPVGTSQLSACTGLQADCLHRVDIDPAEFPNATCSDGTPGVFYVRPGIGDDINKWVIHLQGGGGCRDYDSCLQRWCGQQGALPYTANKMSSEWTGDGVVDLLDHAEAGGMASNASVNLFSTWTHVFAYYCSSDSWMGDAEDVTYTDGVNSFDLDARGHRILVAMRRMLRKNNANSGWTSVDNYSVPDVDLADEIIFSGTSAGAKGAIHNADWFLRPIPVDKKKLVLDANMDIGDHALLDHDVWVDTDLDGVGDDRYYSYRIGEMNDLWTVGGYYEAINAFVDTTCRDHYEPLGRMDRCSEISTLLLFNMGGVPVIETETFVRYDLEDGVAGKQYLQHPNVSGYSLLMGGSGGVPISADEYAILVRATLLELYNDHDTVTGVFAPRCAHHVGLEENFYFGNQLTPDTDEAFTPPALVVGTDASLHDAVWDWFNTGLADTIPSRRLDTDDLGAAFSSC